MTSIVTSPKAILSSFADDTKGGKSIATPMYEARLQDDLNLIYRWAELNNMIFNSIKFQGIRFCSLHILIQERCRCPIDQTKVVKDLGVLLFYNLSVEQHIRAMASSCQDGSGELFSPEALG